MNEPFVRPYKTRSGTWLHEVGVPNYSKTLLLDDGQLEILFNEVRRTVNAGGDD